MNVYDTCRLAVELNEEYGELAFVMAARAAATFAADGFEDRACMWRALHAVLGDIAAKRFDPCAPIVIH